MIISEKNRREISKYLFQVCYAKEDYNLAKHPEIDVPNLQVIKLMQSFKSKEYVLDLQDLMVTDLVLVIGMVTVVDQEGQPVNLVGRKVELLLTFNLHSG
ncbi:hypothetical protein SASPL_107538 [Salvia splendens]|uniref:Plectin/eS10 N-terminal domain-containing protein n=1 Tax=Salvia splendens TaxID=180675 RepID=A0A8X8YF14_SALSN|nr:hypothetical protein SASPL_107538 [Salvia splendens]